MVASRQVEFPFQKCFVRQLGTAFGALAHAIGRTAKLFLREYVNTAAKRVGNELLDFAASKK